jgi:tRNA-2-methylthio-N6-dimethylallyladenosine synthase
VLVEGPSKNALKSESGPGPVQLTGRTRTDHIVVFDGNERLIGQTVRVRIDEATSFTLFATVETTEQVGAPAECGGDEPAAKPAIPGRIGLPLV